MHYYLSDGKIPYTFTDEEVQLALMAADDAVAVGEISVRNATIDTLRKIGMSISRAVALAYYVSP